MNPNEKLKGEEVIKCFNIVINLLNNKYDANWKVESQVSRTSFGVDQGSKIVQCPSLEYFESPKSNVTKLKVSKMIYHEIFTHVLRRLNNPIILPSYLEAEEGLATFMENIPKHSDIIKTGGGEATTLLFALQDIGFNSQELLEFSEAANLQSKKENPEKPTSYTGSLLRMLRGSHYDAKTHTSAKFNKDRAYANGRVIISYFVDLTQSNDTRISNTALQIQRILLQAKFNPLNLHHLLYLQEMGLLKSSPEDIRYFIQNS